MYLGQISLNVYSYVVDYDPNKYELCLGFIMIVCYNKLWKLLIDKNMTKTELCKRANISTNAMAHMGKNEDVRVEVLARICGVLECTLDDIVDVGENINNL